MTRGDTDSVQNLPLVLEPIQDFGLSPFLLKSGKWTLGTSHECDLRVDVHGVDSQHCLIIASAKRAVVRAWDSRTWINERPVLEAVLRDGDRLAIGPVEFQVRHALPDELLEQLPEPEELEQPAEKPSPSPAPVIAKRAQPSDSLGDVDPETP